MFQTTNQLTTHIYIYICVNAIFLSGVTGTFNQPLYLFPKKEHRSMTTHSSWHVVGTYRDWQIPWRLPWNPLAMASTFQGASVPFRNIWRKTSWNGDRFYFQILYYIYTYNHIYIYPVGSCSLLNIA